MINTQMPIARLSLVLLSMFLTATTYGAVTVVYPTGVNPTDVQNIQAAVNQGGSILLKAVNQAGHPQSFNFGSWPDTGTIPVNASVTLTANVAISGEQVGPNRTTILGGVVPFYEADTAVKASITGLKFVNPAGTAVAIFRSAGITILNNEVDGVLPDLDSGFTENLGFFIGGVANTTISGPVIISGNYIHGLDAQYEFGIQANGVESAMTITGNTIDIGYATDAAAGQVNSQGIAIFSSSGAAVISGNNVSVGPGVCWDGIAVHGPATGAATILGNQVTIDEAAFCYNGIEITGTTGAGEVVGNSVDSESPYSDGIALVGEASQGGNVTGVTIALNSVNIENSEFSAIGIYGAVAKSSISLNLITGESAYALSAQSDGIPTDICSSNSFIDNLILGFTASDATIFLDTNTVNNVVSGDYTSVINNGTGNKVSKGFIF